MDNFDLLASQARNKLVAEANRIADTDAAYDDLINGAHSIVLTPAGSAGIRPRRTLAIATTLAIVAAAVAIGVIVTRRNPSTDVTIIPATDAPTPTSLVTASTVEPSPTVETTISSELVTTTIDDSTPPTTEPAAPPSSVFPAVGVTPLDPNVPVIPGAAWEDLDPGPLSPRWDPVVVATDHEIIVLGGWVGAKDPVGSDYLQRVGDGAAYDPVAKAWRMLADPNGLFTQVTNAVWIGGTDKRLMLVGPELASIYDPTNGAHQAIDPPPFSNGMFFTAGTSVFTATVEVPGSVTLARTVGTAAKWDVLPPVGLSAVYEVLEVGGNVVAVGTIEDISGNQSGANAHMLTDTGWIDLAMPGGNWGAFFATTDGQRLLVWGGYGFGDGLRQGIGSWLDPNTGSWQDLANIEELWWECSADGVQVPGGLVIDDCGEVVHYRSAENSATPRPELALWGSRGGLPMVLLGGHLYRWGEPTFYAEGPPAPEAMKFGRLALVPG
jgi:hypothetical protein